MSKITVSPEDFSDVVVSYLFDKMLNPDEVTTGNEDFNKLVDDMNKKGMRPLLMKYYLNMDGNDRLKYKRIKDTFDPDLERDSTIQIRPSLSKSDKKDNKITGLLKTAAKKLLKQGKVTPEEAKLIVEELDLTEEV